MILQESNQQMTKYTCNIVCQHRGLGRAALCTGGKRESWELVGSSLRQEVTRALRISMQDVDPRYCTSTADQVRCQRILMCKQTGV